VFSGHGRAALACVSDAYLTPKILPAAADLQKDMLQRMMKERLRCAKRPTGPQSFFRAACCAQYFFCRQHILITQTHKHTNTYIQINTHVRLYIRTRIYRHTLTCICISMCVYRRAENSTTPVDELGINPKKFHGILLNSGAPTPAPRARGPAFKANIKSLPAGPTRR
jgi:hypothetical protein